jgi:hypothetical protein
MERKLVLEAHKNLVEVLGTFQKETGQLFWKFFMIFVWKQIVKTIREKGLVLEFRL